MSKGLWRHITGALVAILTAVTVSACTDWFNPPPAEWRPEEIKELASATDSALSLVASLSDGEKPSHELRAAIQPVIAAANAAILKIQRRSRDIQIHDRLDQIGYAEVISCAEARIVSAAYADKLLEKVDDSGREGDELTSSDRQELLVFMAQEATRCATSHAEYLRATTSQAAIDKLGAATSEIYAIATALRAAARLGLEGLLRDHIAANEIIAARLARECAKTEQVDSGARAVNLTHRCVSYSLAVDALPKLRSTLSGLSGERA